MRVVSGCPARGQRPGAGLQCRHGHDSPGGVPAEDPTPAAQHRDHLQLHAVRRPGQSSDTAVGRVTLGLQFRLKRDNLTKNNHTYSTSCAW